MHARPRHPLHCKELNRPQPPAQPSRCREPRCGWLASRRAVRCRPLLTTIPSAEFGKGCTKELRGLLRLSRCGHFPDIAGVIRVWFHHTIRAEETHVAVPSLLLHSRVGRGRRDVLTSFPCK